MKHWYPRGQFDLGVGGLALLRATPFRDRSDLLAEISDRVCERAAWLTETVETEEYDFRAGYALWSDTYDSIDNPLIALEEPAIEPLLAAVPPGTALDAACGTGRLTARLVAHGHRVIGVDGSETMLDKARGRLPDVEFRRGDLLALPLPDESMELAVCGLALEHCEDWLRPWPSWRGCSDPKAGCWSPASIRSRSCSEGAPSFSTRPGGAASFAVTRTLPVTTWRPFPAPD
jgi:SAM-dependent methyltransferase